MSAAVVTRMPRWALLSREPFSVEGNGAEESG
jgi:hypothetical protein